MRAKDYAIARDYNTNLDRLSGKKLEGCWREFGFSALSPGLL